MNMFKSPIKELISHMHRKNRKFEKFNYLLNANKSLSPANEFKK